MLKQTGFALAALVLAAAAQAAGAATAPLAYGDGTAAAAHYHVSFDGHFWNGAVRKYEHDFALTKVSDARTDVALDKSETSEHLSLPAKRGADGTLDLAPSSEQLGPYNTLARLIPPAGTAIAAGAAWDVSVPVSIGQGHDVEIPLHATVAKLDGERVLVQASGTRSITATFGGFSTPMEITVRLASAFAGGRFQRLQGTVDELVQAGPQTQKLGWTYALEAR